MKKTTVLLVVLLLSLVFVEAQMFESPGRNVAARHRAEASMVNRPAQTASVMHAQRYRSEQQRRSVLPIVRSNIVDDNVQMQQRQTATRSNERARGIGVVKRVDTIRWKPRQTLPPPPSHRSTLFSRTRQTSSGY